MTGIRRVAVTCLLFLGLASLSGLYVSTYPQESSGPADEPVENLTIRIGLAPDSAPLDGYLAVDLGVGTPLLLVSSTAMPGWLAASPEPNAVAGDLPLQPARDAVFEFRAPATPEPEDYGRRYVFFRNLRVSDIGRVGFLAPVSAAWTLDTVEVSANGRVLLAVSNGRINPSESRSETEAQLQSLGQDLGTREQELRDLRALQEAGLATQADLERLVQLEQELAELDAQRRWLEGVLAGRYPFYVERRFLNPLRGGFPLTQLELLLETAPAPDAGTVHSVFLKLGGHSVLLNPQGDELEPPGSYALPVDLFSVPLVPSDLRRVELAVLARPSDPPGEVDLLRLRRVALAIDGRTFYDSDQSTIDRMSLQAVALGPPVWRQPDGSPGTWQPTTEWLPVWTAGAGQGLQVALPGSSGTEGPVDAGGPPVGPGLPGWPLPGPGPMPGWDPTWGLPPVWIDVFFGWLLPPLPLPPWIWPPPIGPVFQVDDVRIVSGWKQTHNFRVSWDLVGDAGAVDHFVVELLPFDPAMDPPITGPAFATQVLPAAARSFVFPTPVPGVPPPYTLAMVTAVPTNPLLAVNTEISPARPVFPTGSSAAVQPALLSPFFYSTGGPFSPEPVSYGGPPGPVGRAVWPFGVDSCHFGWRLGRAVPGLNIAVRPGPSDTATLLFLQSTSVNGPKTLVFELGFVGDLTAADTVQVQVHAFGPGGPWGPANAVLTVDPTLPPPPLVRVQLPINVAGPANVIFRIRVQGGNASPLQPVGLFGVRLQP